MESPNIAFPDTQSFASMIFANENLSKQQEFYGIVGCSKPLMKTLNLVRTVAPTDSTVLIQGETGTGKELIAHAIHNASSRRGRALIKLNCAAIPLDLLESELFGHERGAFTGAITQKIGRFEMAHQGTLFLDEVGDIPPALQPKLLRVLQEHEFERLGSGRTHHVDIRLVAATNRDLEALVAQGKFRSDLYYRLNVFPILLPPLRSRREDVPALVELFVNVFSRRMSKQIDYVSPDTMAAFQSYAWPGNVRELENMIERAVILANNGVLPNPLPAPGPPTTTCAVAARPANLNRHVPKTLRDSQHALILATLDATRWVIGGTKGAAVQLGLKRTTLIDRMKRLGIQRPSERPGSPATFVGTE
jgi:transcriptional regulator with GAF, ATPase, and Fis domain